MTMPEFSDRSEKLATLLHIPHESDNTEFGDGDDGDVYYDMTISIHASRIKHLYVDSAAKDILIKATVIDSLYVSDEDD